MAAIRLMQLKIPIDGMITRACEHIAAAIEAGSDSNFPDKYLLADPYEGWIALTSKDCFFKANPEAWAKAKAKGAGK
jgi:hypothetical protein